MTLRLLDLFCGAGGASMGYHRAGFEVVGIDIEPHPDYPFELIVGDAVEVLADAEYLRQFDAIHASPPCPRYSQAGNIGSYDPLDKPDLVGPTRDMLNAAEVPWVIENVPGAPMPAAVMICGWGVGVRIRRHRLFESSVLLMSPGCACPTDAGPAVFGHSSAVRRNGERQHIPLSETRQIMGVEWMTRRDDVSDSIPPAYTEHVGGFLVAAIEAVAA